MSTDVYAAQPLVSHIVQTKNSDNFVLSFEASNLDRSHAFVYNYSSPKTQDWILNIEDNLTYVPRDGSKTIIRLHEPAPSDKFIEVAIYGDQTREFWVAVNSIDTGYTRVVDQKPDGWSTEGPISVGYEAAQGLSVTDGKRIVIDRMNLNGFVLGSISVFGKDNSTAPANTYGGTMSFNLDFGNPADSPLFYYPVAITVGVIAVIGGLLVVKKRRADD
jgi:hypothetical protein